MTRANELFEEYKKAGVASLMVPCSVIDGELTVVEPDRLTEAIAYEKWLKETP